MRKFFENLLNLIDSSVVAIIIGPVSLARIGYGHVTCGHLRAARDVVAARRFCAQMSKESHLSSANPARDTAECLQPFWGISDGRRRPLDRSTEKSMTARGPLVARPSPWGYSYPLRAGSSTGRPFQTSWRRSRDTESGCIRCAGTWQTFDLTSFGSHEAETRRTQAPTARACARAA
jgi:hypothetical protein